MKIKTKYNLGDNVYCHNSDGEIVVGTINEIKFGANLYYKILYIYYVIVEPHDVCAEIGEYDEPSVIGKATPKILNKVFNKYDKGEN